MEKALRNLGMEEENKVENHLTSAAAFVDGGIQDACDDACSICLEEFTESDPSTVTGCKHEFHLQCILEWCQRSSQCPMCWQAISLKDSMSQELLEGVERERKIRLAPPPRRAAVFYHPTLGEFDLQNFRIRTNNPELEERIIQHLAAAAARGRTHRFSRREGLRSRSSANGRPQYLVFSTHSETPPGAAETSEQTQQLPSGQTNRTPSPANASTVIRTNHQVSSFNDSQSSSPMQDTAGPSDIQSITDSLKSRFNSMSIRYKDSISKSTKGWKERLFSRSSSMAGREGQGSRITGIPSATSSGSVVHRMNRLSVNERSIHNGGEDGGENTLSDSESRSSRAASTAST